MRFIGVVLVLLAASATYAQPPGACLVERYEWHDADTPVKCVLRLPWASCSTSHGGFERLGTTLGKSVRVVARMSPTRNGRGDARRWRKSAS